MSIIKPFKAVRPKVELAQEVASLPYDVMNSKEAREMAKGKPNSFLHVSRAEIDLLESIDEHSDEVYNKARENFNRFIKEGVLVQDNAPYLYIYQQIMNGRKQTGLVCCSSVEDYFNDVIKKHEFTRPEKEQDRIHHMETLQAHVGPIFLTYPHNAKVDMVVQAYTTGKHKPVYDFTSEDSIQHTVWVVDNEQLIHHLVAVFNEDIPFTYIADGHHRTASAAKVGLKMKEANANHTGEEDYNFFLSVLFPDNQLAIMDYNRVIKDLNDHSEEELLSKLKENFEVRATESIAKPEAIHQFGMYLNGKWYSLTSKAGTFTTDPIGILDVTILEKNVLNPLFGIVDQRTDKRIDFIGGIRGLKELEKRVDSGDWKVAFALYPVSLKQLMDIADSGDVMPPKSTWFEPKLRDGLFSHLF
ncbi:MAG: DUF1015 family protein [Chitinophagales bacterium]